MVEAYTAVTSTMLKLKQGLTTGRGFKVSEGLSFRYFVDLTEVLDAGTVLTI